MAGTNDNSGTLSVNTKKSEDPVKNKWMADARGKATIEGKEYYINGYIKKGQYGRFTSLQFVPVKKKDGEKEAPKVEGKKDLVFFLNKKEDEELF